MNDAQALGGLAALGAFMGLIVIIGNRFFMSCSPSACIPWLTAPNRQPRDGIYPDRSDYTLVE
jgi:hypothetical protein